MNSITDLPGKQTLDGTTLAGGVKQKDAHVAHPLWIVACTLWIIGFLALVVASVIVRLHPAPWPLDLQTTIILQHLQAHLPSWVSTPIVWASIVNDPIPSAIGYFAWLVGLVLIGVLVRRRGGSPIPWVVAAIFITFGIGIMDGLGWLFGFFAARPRPSSLLIHVFMPVTAVASFPSGHVDNVVLYYGFLLYLSLSKPISQWRYRWTLIPFQLYAALNILLIGYSRVVEGSHWLTDVLGGCLAGVLWLVLLIVVYRYTLNRLTQWYAKRQLAKSTRTQGS